MLTQLPVSVRTVPDIQSDAWRSGGCVRIRRNNEIKWVREDQWKTDANWAGEELKLGIHE